MTSRANKAVSKARSALWKFSLYIADGTPRSIRALKNLTVFCERECPGKYQIKVVDILANPRAARTENIVALPTLVRTSPAPMRRVIGDLSDARQLISGLDMPRSA